MTRPPAALDSQARKKSRASSFGEFVSRLRPSNRAERGGTLRNEVSTSVVSAETSSHCEGSDKNQPRGGSHRIRMISLNYRNKGHTPEVPLFPEREETTNTQRIFEDKRDQRQNRQLLRNSGDFLGVQGANPRTGFWDPSASTSTQSQTSEGTKLRLDQEKRNVAEQRKKYEEAQARFKQENEDREAARGKRRAEKAEQRKEEQILRQRRHGRWRMGDNGWRSVAEPELSPIVQSAFGSPVRESALSGEDRLFPMPTSADPLPYVDSGEINPKDYFGHRTVSSPLVNKHNAQRNPSVARKSIDSPSVSCHEPLLSSSGTIVQTPLIHESPLDSWPQNSKFATSSICASICARSPENLGAKHTQSSNTFLGRNLPEARNTIVTSHQPTSTSPAQNRQQSAQNLPLENQIIPIECFPPVVLKNPAIALKPLSSQINTRFPEVESKTITRNYPAKNPISMTQVKSIQVLKSNQDESVSLSKQLSNIPIITTTGYDHHQHHQLGQLDGLSELINEAQANRPLQGKSNLIPVRTSSFMRTSSPIKKLQNNQFQTNQAIATSSEHLLGQTKRRTAELCRKESPIKEGDIMSIPISISMYPQKKENKKVARNAALMAMKPSPPPKDRKPFMNQKGGPMISRPRPKVVLEGPEGTGSPSGVANIYERKEEAVVYQRNLIIMDGSVGTKYGLEDKLVVWHPTPAKLEDKRALAPFIKITNVEADREAAKCNPKNEDSQVSFGQAVCRVLQTAWWFVGPIFDTESALRKRWEEDMISWQDISIFITAGIFGMCLGLMAIVCGRIVGMCLRILRVVKGF